MLRLRKGRFSLDPFNRDMRCPLNGRESSCKHRLVGVENIQLKLRLVKGNFSVKSGKFGKVYQVNMIGFRIFVAETSVFFLTALFCKSESHHIQWQVSLVRHPDAEKKASRNVGKLPMSNHDMTFWS